MRKSAISTTEGGSSQVFYSDAQLNRSMNENRRSVACCRCCDPRNPRLQCLSRSSEAVKRSLLWKLLDILFTFVLLFGSPIQMLLVPKDWDIMFDIIYTATLFYFLMDMAVNLITDREYFTFCGSSASSYRQVQTAAWRFGFGSFKFWCDVISAATLIFDLSYINQNGYAVSEVNISLDQFGLPVNFGSQVNPSHPVSFDVEILIVIARTARIARSVRSSTVVGISSKLNFYWYLEHLTPGFYIKKYRAWRQEKQEAEEQKAKMTTATADLKMSDLAAAKAKQHQEANERKQKTVMDGFINGMRYLGLASDPDVEIKQKKAAIKIQRAWRRKMAQPPGVDAFTDDSTSWRGRLRRSSSVFNRVLGTRQPKSARRQSQNSTAQTQAGGFDGSLECARNEGKVEEARPESQLGTAMSELTGQRIALGVLFGLILTSLFTYRQKDATPATAMVMLHGQTISTTNTTRIERALKAARISAASDMFTFNSFRSSDDTELSFDYEVEQAITTLRKREMLRVTISSDTGTTTGTFTYRQQREDEALAELLSTLFVLLMWFIGVTAFAGPVMTLVVMPIERMVRLLRMLMLDPLGYQSSSRFKKFMIEDELIVKNSRWTREVLKGMETSFLMSTILRIGSLMKVGFGSAGVEIIRNNLAAGQNTNTLILSSEGSTVSCIFLFCDVRQFTDATECLQEEVFVFTNRIAAVVHSNCHAYGGSANKNVGDAFLVSWLLDDDKKIAGQNFNYGGPNLTANHNQADKSMLSVVRICMALHYDEFYLEPLSSHARNKLLAKVKKRRGPVVQMGCGLHAGKAVQGAIGSQRKIDATYVSEAVERAEFLESSTKQYGLQMLLSDAFYDLLHTSNRRRCRKIDQIMFSNEDGEEEEGDYDTGDRMDLYTYDMDIEALWRNDGQDGFEKPGDDSFGFGGGGLSRQQSSKAGMQTPTRKIRNRRKSILGFGDSAKSEELKPPGAASSEAGGAAAGGGAGRADAIGSAFFTIKDKAEVPKGRPREPELPTGPKIYTAGDWLEKDMRKIRHRYTTVIFQKFNSGLDAYYTKEWEHAKQCFQAVLDQFEDGPSKYFMAQMEKYDGKPPRGFQPFGVV